MKKEINHNSLNRTSAIIQHLIDNLDGSKLTIDTLLVHLGKRSFGLIIIVFSLPNALPISVLPGFSTICGILILLASIQMILAIPSLWLPNFIRNKEISSTQFVLMMKKCLPYLEKIEKYIKPRWWLLSSAFGERILGIIISFFALLLMLPIPFSNMVLGLLISISALGLIENDGLMILIGWVGATIWGLLLLTFFIHLYSWI